jgi:hypothetical protein
MFFQFHVLTCEVKITEEMDKNQFIHLHGFCDYGNRAGFDKVCVETLRQDSGFEKPSKVLCNGYSNTKREESLGKESSPRKHFYALRAMGQWKLRNPERIEHNPTRLSMRNSERATGNPMHA